MATNYDQWQAERRQRVNPALDLQNARKQGSKFYLDDYIQDREDYQGLNPIDRVVKFKNEFFSDLSDEEFASTFDATLRLRGPRPEQQVEQPPMRPPMQAQPTSTVEEWLPNPGWIRTMGEAAASGARGLGVSTSELMLEAQRLAEGRIEELAADYLSKPPEEQARLAKQRVQISPSTFTGPGKSIEVPGETVAYEELPALAQRAKEIQNRLQGEQVQRYEEYKAKQPKVMQESPWSPKGLVATGVEALTRMAPGLVAGAITRNPVVGAAGVMPDVYGMTLTEGLQEHKLPMDQARTRAAAFAVFEGATEAIPFSFVFGKLGKTALDDAVRVAVINNAPKAVAAKQSLKTLGATAVAESAQEAVVEVMNKSYDSLTNVQDFTLGEWINDVAYSAVVGGMIGGALGAPRSVSEFNEIRKTTNTYKDILFAESPDEAMQEFMRNFLTADGSFPLDIIQASPEVEKAINEFFGYQDDISDQDAEDLVNSVKSDIKNNLEKGIKDAYVDEEIDVGGEIQTTLDNIKADATPEELAELERIKQEQLAKEQEGEEDVDPVSDPVSNETTSEGDVDLRTAKEIAEDERRSAISSFIVEQISLDTSIADSPEPWGAVKGLLDQQGFQYRDDAEVEALTRQAILDWNKSQQAGAWYDDLETPLEQDRPLTELDKRLDEIVTEGFGESMDVLAELDPSELASRIFIRPNDFRVSNRETYDTILRATSEAVARKLRWSSVQLGNEPVRLVNPADGLNGQERQMRVQLVAGNLRHDSRWEAYMERHQLERPQAEQMVAKVRERVAREIVAERDQLREMRRSVFDSLVELEERAPRRRLAEEEDPKQIDPSEFHTSTPIAYLAGSVAEIQPNSVVYDPSVGSGALLLNADMANTIVAGRMNEMDPAMEVLEKVEEDSIDRFYRANGELGIMAKDADAVLVHPPSGIIPLTERNTFMTKHGTTMNHREYITVADGLSRMKDDGKGVVLVPASGVEHGMTRQNVSLLTMIGNQYEIGGVMRIDSKLTSRHEKTSKPMLMIKVDGRKDATAKVDEKPKAAYIPTAKTHDEMFDMAGALQAGARFGFVPDTWAETRSKFTNRKKGEQGEGSRNTNEGGTGGSRSPGGRQGGGQGGPGGRRAPGENKGPGGGTVTPRSPGEGRGTVTPRTPGKPRTPGGTRPPGTPGGNETRNPISPSGDKRNPKGDSKPEGKPPTNDSKEGDSGSQPNGKKKPRGDGKGDDQKPPRVDNKKKPKGDTDDTDENNEETKTTVNIADSLGTPVGTKSKRKEIDASVETQEEEEHDISVKDLGGSQVGYESISGESEMLTPGALGDSTAEAMRNELASIKKLSAYQDIEDSDVFAAFVRDELQYDTLEQVRAVFDTHQIDGIAMSIRNMQRGQGMVIADGTGSGKGRQAAGIARWALRHNKMPVFVTEKAHLFNPFYNDLNGVGIAGEVNPLILNDGEAVRTFDAQGVAGGQWYGRDGRKVDKWREFVAEVVKGETNVPNNMIMSTYSQFSTKGALGGQNTQQQLMSKVVEDRGKDNVVFIFDEAHNAVSMDGRAANYLRDLSNDSPMTALSATLTRRPEDMMLFINRTKVPSLLGKTSLSITDLKSVFLDEAGNVNSGLMGYLTSHVLARSGQYLAREVSMADVELKLSKPTASSTLGKRYRTMSDSFADSLRLLAEADNMVVNAGADRNYRLSAGNVLRTLSSQFSVAMQVDNLVAEAIDKHENSEKIVIALDNTNESEVKQIADVEHLQSFSIAGVFERRIRHGIQILRDASKADGIDVTMRSQYKEQIKTLEKHVKKIHKSPLANLSISPIDAIIEGLQKAGIRAGEITGRTTRVVDGKRLENQNREHDYRVKAVDMFNGGGLDALVLNSAGSTGISLQASKDYLDQKPRHMFVAQTFENVRTFQQMIGRINRRGQVQLPKYTMFSSGLPTDQLKLNNLSRKISEMNASTKGMEKGLSEDLLNNYSDRIVNNALRSHPYIASQMFGANVETFIANEIVDIQTGITAGGRQPALNGLSNRVYELSVRLDDSTRRTLFRIIDSNVKNFADSQRQVLAKGDKEDSVRLNMWVEETREVGNGLFESDMIRSRELKRKGPGSLRQEVERNLGDLETALEVRDEIMESKAADYIKYVDLSRAEDMTAEHKRRMELSSRNYERMANALQRFRLGDVLLLKNTTGDKTTKAVMITNLTNVKGTGMDPYALDSVVVDTYVAGQGNQDMTLSQLVGFNEVVKHVHKDEPIWNSTVEDMYQIDEDKYARFKAYGGNLFAVPHSGPVVRTTDQSGTQHTLIVVPQNATEHERESEIVSADQGESVKRWMHDDADAKIADRKGASTLVPDSTAPELAILTVDPKSDWGYLRDVFKDAGWRKKPNSSFYSATINMDQALDEITKSSVAYIPPKQRPEYRATLETPEAVRADTIDGSNTVPKFTGEVTTSLTDRIRKAEDTLPQPLLNRHYRIDRINDGKRDENGYLIPLNSIEDMERLRNFAEIHALEMTLGDSGVRIENLNDAQERLLKDEFKSFTRLSYLFEADQRNQALMMQDVLRTNLNDMHKYQVDKTPTGGFSMRVDVAEGSQTERLVQYLQDVDNYGQPKRKAIKTGTFENVNPSIRSSAPPNGMSVSELEALVESLQLEHNVTVKVVEDEADMPTAMKERISDLPGHVIDAYTEGDQVTLVANNIENVDRAKVLLAHELIGHVGVSHIMRKDEWDSIKKGYQRIKAQNPAEYVSIMRELNKRYGAMPDMDTEIREFLGIAAERRAHKGAVRMWYNRIRIRVRSWLRSQFMGSDFSMLDIDDILNRSERHVLKTPGQLSVNFHKAPDLVDPVGSRYASIESMQEEWNRSHTGEAPKQWVDMSKPLNEQQVNTRKALESLWRDAGLEGDIPSDMNAIFDALDASYVNTRHTVQDELSSHGVGATIDENGGVEVHLATEQEKWRTMDDDVFNVDRAIRTTYRQIPASVAKAAKEWSDDALKRIQRESKRFFSKYYLLGEDAYEVIRDAQKSESSAIQDDMLGFRSAFERTLKLVYGGKKLSRKIVADMNDYLKGDESARTHALPRPIKAALTAMRNHIDRNTLAMVKSFEDDIKTMRAEGKTPKQIAAKINMAEKFGKNKGSYLNRAFAVHHDDKWYHKIHNNPEHAGKFERAVNKLATEIIIAEEKKIKIPKEPKRPQPLKARRPSAQTQLKYIERMERYYRRMEKYEQKLEEIAEKSVNLKDDAKHQAETLINKLLTQGTAYDNIAQAMWNGHLGQKDLSILMRRKEIPKEIREVMGEYEDPLQNYVRTVEKQIKYITGDTMLKNLKQLGLQAGWLWEKYEDVPLDMQPHVTEYARGAQEANLPMSGMYITRDMAQGMDDFLGRIGEVEMWLKVWRNINFVVKSGKTVYSPITAARNFLSGHALLVTMGFSPFHGKVGEVGGLDYLSYHFRGYTKAEYKQEFKKLRMLGVMDDSVHGSEQKKLMDESNFQDMLDKVFGSYEVTNKVRRKMENWLIDVPRIVYTFGDDFWKIMAFYQVRDRYEKYGSKNYKEEGGMSREEAEKRAALYVRRLMPTYSETPLFIDKVRRNPAFGSFPSFTWEIWRNLINHPKSLYEEAKEFGVNNPIFIKHAMGMLTQSAMWGVWGSGAIAYASQLLFGISDEEDEAYQQLIGPWQRHSNIMYLNKKEDGKVDYLDLSHLNIYATTTRTLRSIIDTRGKQSMGEYLEYVIDEAAGAIVGPEIFASAAYQTFTGKDSHGRSLYNEEIDSGLKKTWERVKHLGSSIQPGVTSQLYRLGLAMADAPMSSRSGKGLKVPFELASFAGFRVTEFDPEKAGSYIFSDIRQEMQNIQRTGSYALTKWNDWRDPTIMDLYEDIDDARMARHARMQYTMDLLRDVGFDSRRIVNMMDLAGVSNNQQILYLTDTYKPMDPSVSSAMKAMTSLRAYENPDYKDDVDQRWKDALEFTYRRTRELQQEAGIGSGP